MGNVRGSKTEAQANIWKHAQESNMTEGKTKQLSNMNSRPSMVAPRVPEGITVKQQSSKTLKKGSTSGKQLAARKQQSEAAMKYLEEQARRATQAKQEKASPKQARPTQANEEKATSAKVGKSSAEKRPQQSKTIGTSADNQECPPIKRARRSDEALASPRKLELVGLPKAKVPSRLFSTASEDLRMKGRPVNAKGLRLMPLGRLRFYVREVVKEGKCHGLRRGGAEAGFIDDVEKGERLVVKRTFKDLSYQALRYCSKDSFTQRTQGNREGWAEAEAKELLPVRLLPVRQKSSVKEMMVDLEDGKAAAGGDPCWTISRSSI